MKAGIKKNITDKKKGIDLETQEYEYDITNDEGEKFHVTVHREIMRKSMPERIEEEL